MEYILFVIVYSCGETRVFDEQAQRPKYRKGELVKWSFTTYQQDMKNAQMTALCKRYESCVNEALLCI